MMELDTVELTREYAKILLKLLLRKLFAYNKNREKPRKNSLNLKTKRLPFTTYVALKVDDSLMLTCKSRKL